MPETARRVNFCSPRFFSFFFGEKLPKSSGITHMVTGNGGHPLHHHLRHSIRLSNSLFNRRTTKPTFTQWPQASALQFTPQWPSRPLISTPADRVQSLQTLYVLDLSRSILTVQIQNPYNQKKHLTQSQKRTQNLFSGGTNQDPGFLFLY